MGIIGSERIVALHERGWIDRTRPVWWSEQFDPATKHLRRNPTQREYGRMIPEVGSRLVLTRAQFEQGLVPIAEREGIKWNVYDGEHTPLCVQQIEVRGIGPVHVMIAARPATHQEICADGEGMQDVFDWAESESEWQLEREMRQSTELFHQGLRTIVEKQGAWPFKEVQGLAFLPHVRGIVRDVRDGLCIYNRLEEGFFAEKELLLEALAAAGMNYVHIFPDPDALRIATLQVTARAELGPERIAAKPYAPDRHMQETQRRLFWPEIRVCDYAEITQQELNEYGTPYQLEKILETVYIAPWNVRERAEKLHQVSISLQFPTEDIITYLPVRIEGCSSVLPVAVATRRRPGLQRGLFALGLFSDYEERAGGVVPTIYPFKDSRVALEVGMQLRHDYSLDACPLVQVPAKGAPRYRTLGAR